MNIQYFSHDPVMNFGMVLFFFVFLMLFIIFVVFVISLFKKVHYRNFKPYISVIIPAYNEEKNIKKCLKSIFNSRYDLSKLEIICVDDGSTDKTAETILKLSKKHKNIKLIKGKHKGKSEAINLGVKHSTHDYILTIDADTVLDKFFIKEIIRPFSDKKVGATNAIALVQKPKRLVEHFQDVEYFFNNLIRNSFSKIFHNGIWFFGASACFRKSVLKKAGLFRSNVLTEDMDIALRIFELGYEVLTVETAFSYTEACSSLKELFKQRMRWFHGGLQCTFKHNKLFKKNSFAIRYLIVEKYFWAGFSLIVFPLIIYQIFYWMPAGFFSIISYLFRWFSLFGPIYVLYKIPEWGLSLINIFGVSSGIITVIMTISSIYTFKDKINIFRILVIIFYFPYTLFLNLILIYSIINYFLNKQKYFLE
ncbi:glycosyltransferase family 2 protein [Candidatus Woesearchaeota archaeon]|nr:glycosyltransferase family 2 protein [Candidatus Woesearchaeota archaeon]